MTKDAWPIIILSLADATERRAEMTAQMQKAGLPFSFFDAIDGRKGLPTEWESSIDRPGTLAKHGYPMSDGEYACALSHQMIYKKVVDAGLPGAVILEDDAILTPEFVTWYRNGAYSDHDFTQLFCRAARIWRGYGRSIGLPGVRLFRLAENAFAACGYSLSKRAAKHIQSKSLPLRDRADWPVDMTKLNAMITVPSIIQHPDPLSSQSQLAASRPNPIAAGIDFNARYPKGWRRLVSASAWRRAIVRRLSRMVAPAQGG